MILSLKVLACRMNLPSSGPRRILVQKCPWSFSRENNLITWRCGGADVWWKSCEKPLSLINSSLWTALTAAIVLVAYFPFRHLCTTFFDGRQQDIDIILFTFQISSTDAARQILKRLFVEKCLTLKSKA